MASNSRDYVGISIHDAPLTGTENDRRPPRPPGPRHFMKQVSRMSFKEGMRTAGKTVAKMTRIQSSAQQGLKGLRFLDKTTNGKDGWKSVEKCFDDMAVHGRLAKESFGKCIGEILNFFFFSICEL
jgi:Respiratory burst NADPH oxidase